MRTRTSMLVALFVAALASGSLAGCGGSAGDSGPQPGGSVSTSPSAPGSSSALPPSGPVSLPPSSSPKYPSGEMTLTGKPEPGVEANCLMMRSGDTLYNLLGGDRQLLTSGRTVVVRGAPNPGLLTTCQQGVPFQVSEVRAA